MDHRLGIHLAQNGRRFAHRDGIAAKGLDPKAQAAQILRDLQQASARVSRKVHDLRDQQSLCCHAILRHLGFQLFIDQPFVGGVLVDDHQTGLRLCHDIVLMHLPARHAQWKITCFCFGLGNRVFNPPAIRRRHLSECWRCPRPVAGAVHLIYPRRGRFGPHRAQCCPCHSRGCAMPGFGERMAQPGNDQTACKSRIAEPDLGLGGMHIDIDQFRVAVNKQGRNRMAIPAEKVEIGGAQGTDQQLVFDRSPVDVKKLSHGSPTRIGGQGSVAGQMQGFARCIDGDAVFRELRAQNIRQAAAQSLHRVSGLRFNPKHRAGVVRDIAQFKTHERLCHRQPLDDVADGLRFGPVGAQEFEAGRRRVKQIAQRDHSARIDCSGFDHPHLAAGD